MIGSPICLLICPPRGCPPPPMWHHGPALFWSDPPMIHASGHTSTSKVRRLLNVGILLSCGGPADESLGDRWSRHPAARESTNAMYAGSGALAPKYRWSLLPPEWETGALAMIDNEAGHSWFYRCQALHASTSTRLSYVSSEIPSFS